MADLAQTTTTEIKPLPGEILDDRDRLFLLFIAGGAFDPADLLQPDFERGARAVMKLVDAFADAAKRRKGK